MSTDSTPDTAGPRGRGPWAMLLALTLAFGVVVLIRIYQVDSRDGDWQVRRSIGDEVQSWLRYGFNWLIPTTTSCCGLKQNAGSNMRQILMAAISYGCDQEPAGTWPLDIPALRVWSDGELVDKICRDPRWPTVVDPFVYVRPTPQAKSTQPVLLSRPTPGASPMVVVGYADGHIATVSGTALWLEARCLAIDPKAREEGITAADWEAQRAGPAQP